MLIKKILLVSVFVCILSVAVLAQPNLKWMDTQITMNPANPLESNPVTFSATFRCAKEAASNVKVSAFIDGSQCYSNKYPNLAKGQDTLVSFSWTALAGPHTIEFRLDPDNTLAEYLENDNNLSKNFTVTPKSSPGSGATLTIAPSLTMTVVNKGRYIKKILPDLRTVINVDKQTVAPNETNKFKIVIANQGQLTSPKCKLYIQFALTSGQVLSTIDDFEMPELAPNGALIYYREWTDDTPGNYKITVIADYFKEVAEKNESNNSATAFWTVQ